MHPFTPRRILIAAPIPKLAEALAEERPELNLRVRALGEVTVADLDWAEVFVGFRRPGIEGWGRVRWIHSIGAGVDGLVFRRPLPDTVLLTRSSEDFGPAIGEWCVARALADTQRLFALAEAQRAHQWGLESGSSDPRVLRGQRVVIVGTGMVGGGIARAFRAVGCRVEGLSRSGRSTPDFDATFQASAFAEVVKGADWLILAAPLTVETWHYLDRRRLAQCGGAYLMNVGRGAVLDEAALPEAIAEGWIRGAALDVFEREPLPAESPLWDLAGVTISPHNSGPSTLSATVAGFLECLTAFEAGQPPRWLVTPEVGY